MNYKALSAPAPVTIYRTADAALVNRLLARDGQHADFSVVLDEPQHICLIEGESGAVFLFRGPGIYEVHVFFSVRGREAIRLGHEMLDLMVAAYGARLFWSLVPVESRKVIMFTRLMGWKSHGLRETANGWNELFASEKDTCLQRSP